MGGKSPTITNVEDWNGASWSEVADINTSRRSLGGAGTTTAGLAFGGTPPVTGATEEWSGSSITTKVLTD